MVFIFEITLAYPRIFAVCQIHYISKINTHELTPYTICHNEIRTGKRNAMIKLCSVIWIVAFNYFQNIDNC